MIHYQPVGLEVNMRFIKFLIGGFLVVGSVIALIFIYFVWAFAIAVGHTSWQVILTTIIALVAFFGGIYIIATLRRR
jgi:hypothetical protein